MCGWKVINQGARRAGVFELHRQIVGMGIGQQNASLTAGLERIKERHGILAQRGARTLFAGHRTNIQTRALAPVIQTVPV